jgi:hypothetical protein
MKSKIALDYNGLTPQVDEYYAADGDHPNSIIFTPLYDAVGVLLPAVDGDFFIRHNGFAGSLGEYIVSEGLTGGKLASHQDLHDAVELASQNFITYSTKEWSGLVEKLGDNISPRYKKQ